MHLLGADANLSPQPKLRTIGKAGAGIDIDAGGINFIQKARCRRFIPGDNRLGMPGAVALNVLKRLIQRLDHPHRRLQGEVFFPPVLIGSRHQLQSRNCFKNCPGSLIAVHLHPGFGPLFSDEGQILIGNIGMNQQGIQGIAPVGRCTLALKGNSHRHINIGTLIDIGVADTDAAGHYRHAGVFLDQPD